MSPWWQTDSVGVNTHIRTYSGSWPQYGPMASLSHVRWEESNQSESSWRWSHFYWNYSRDIAGQSTPVSHFSGLSQTLLGQTMPAQVVIIITEMSPWSAGLSLCLLVFSGMCISQSPLCRSDGIKSFYSYCYFGEAQHKIGTLCLWCWYHADTNPTITFLTLAIIIGLRWRKHLLILICSLL